MLCIVIFMLTSGLGFGQFFNTELYPEYRGNDLGLIYTPQGSHFRIWSPAAEKAELIFYGSSLGNDRKSVIQLSKAENGTWKAFVSGNLKGSYYVFRIFTHGKWLAEVPDPYAKAVGTNGRRAVVVDMKDTRPFGWESDKSPVFSSRKGMTRETGGLPVDAVIYELHVRDATIDASSAVGAKGKFSGLTEVAVMNIGAVQTGLDHLQELGVTHIHLLPSYDFYSIDESKRDSLQYNWGYDPLNYLSLIHI